MAAAGTGLSDPARTIASVGRDSGEAPQKIEGGGGQNQGQGVDAPAPVAAVVAAGGDDEKMPIAGYELDPTPSGSSSVLNKKNGHQRLGSDDGAGVGDDLDRIVSSPDAGDPEAAESVGEGDADSARYKVYKRRWFGLLQLTLLNIIVSWDVS